MVWFGGSLGFCLVVIIFVFIEVVSFFLLICIFDLKFGCINFVFDNIVIDDVIGCWERVVDVIDSFMF